MLYKLQKSLKLQDEELEEEELLHDDDRRIVSVKVLTNNVRCEAGSSKFNDLSFGLSMPILWA